MADIIEARKFSLNIGASSQSWSNQEGCHYGSKMANIHEARKLTSWEQDGKHSWSKKAVFTGASSQSWTKKAAIMGQGWQTFMRQESCHHGSKTADMIEARKLSLCEKDGRYDWSKKAVIMEKDGRYVWSKKAVIIEARWKTFKKQESCHYGSKMANIHVAR